MRTLTYFIALAEELNYAKAALRLGVTQPAVTRQIQALEEELQVKLIDETQKKAHKRVVLTEEGVYFYHEALKLVEQQKESLEGLARLRDKKKTLQIGFMAYTPGEEFKKLLKVFATALEEYDFKWKLFHETSSLIDALKRDEIHLAVHCTWAKVPDGWVEATIQKGNLRVLFPPSDPRFCSCEVSTLRGEKGIVVGGLRIKELQTVHEVGNFDQLEALVQAGAGIGIIPSFFSRQRGVVWMPEVPCRWAIWMSRAGHVFERINFNL
jgi:DNA-binding transcriptional LysR family regulator